MLKLKFSNRMIVAGVLVFVALAGVSAAFVLSRDPEEPSRSDTVAPLHQRFGSQLLASGDAGDQEWGAIRKSGKGSECLTVRLFGAEGREEIIDDGCFVADEQGTETRITEIPGVGYITFGRLQGSEGPSAARTVQVSSSAGTDTETRADSAGMFALFTERQPSELTYKTTGGDTVTHAVTDERPK